jgi:hypothetical protein
MRILRATRASSYNNYEEVWLGKGLTGEPLVDTPRLEYDSVLSLFAKADAEGEVTKKNVVILDFQLE